MASDRSIRIKNVPDPKSYSKEQENLPRIPYSTYGILRMVLGRLFYADIDRDLTRLEESADSMAKHIGELVRHALIKPNSLVVDLGCGYGATSRALARFPDFKILGIDLDEVAIRKARELTGKTCQNINFHIADGNNLANLLRDDVLLDHWRSGIDNYDGKVDLVVCQTVFYRFDDLKQSLSQIHGSLKEGGILFFAELDRSYLHRWRTISEAGKKISVLEVYGDLQNLRHHEFRKKYFETPFSDNFKFEVRRVAEFAASYTPFEVADILEILGFELSEFTLIRDREKIPNAFVAFPRKKSTFSQLS